MQLERIEQDGDKRYQHGKNNSGKYKVPFDMYTLLYIQRVTRLLRQLFGH